MLQTRTRHFASVAWIVVALMTVVLMIIVPITLLQLALRYEAQPWGLIFPAATFASLAGVKILNRAGRDSATFLCSCSYVLTMLSAVGFGNYPYLLPLISDAYAGLTNYDALTSSFGLTSG
jgi:cytochrome bd-type quinol oxidase subunit 2